LAGPPSKVVVWNWNLILNLSLSSVVIALVSSFVSGSAGASTETTTLSPSILALGALSLLLDEQPAASNAVTAATAATLVREECGFMVVPFVSFRQPLTAPTITPLLKWRATNG
jgi:hypothetical protein